MHLNVSFPDNDTGYGTVARNIVRGMLRNNVICKYHPMDDLGPKHTNNPDINFMMNLNVHEHFPWLFFYIPRQDFWGRFLRNRVDIKYGIKPMIFWHTVWEPDKLPHGWKYLLKDVYGIITPSEHSASLFRKEFDRVWVAPNPIDTRIYKPEGNSNVFDNRVNFCSVFDWQERKDPNTLLEAFISEFGDVPDVSLFIRSYGTYSKNPVNEFLNTKRSLLKKYGKRNANLFLVREHLSSQQLAAFYRSADAFVLPTHCEGFCNPALEAMACGTVPIITGWSGHLDFCNEKNSLLIDYHLEPVDKKFTSQKIFFENGEETDNPDFLPWYNDSMRWAQADVNHLRELMREVYEGKHRKKRHSCVDTAKKYDMMTCSRRYIEILEENI